jgi:predicted peroxiredoxin
LIQIKAGPGHGPLWVSLQNKGFELILPHTEVPMRTFLTAATLGLATLAAPVSADEKATHMVTILASAEPQTQLMSMVLTMQSMQAGAEAYVLLCGPAGDLALKEPPEAATAPQKPMGMSPQGLMQKVMEEGGTVEVCAIYLPNKGVEADALLDGVTAAKPPAVAARMLAERTRIMSF